MVDAQPPGLAILVKQAPGLVGRGVGVAQRAGDVIGEASSGRVSGANDAAAWSSSVQRFSMTCSSPST